MLCMPYVIGAVDLPTKHTRRSGRGAASPLDSFDGAVHADDEIVEVAAAGAAR